MSPRVLSKEAIAEDRKDSKRLLFEKGLVRTVEQWVTLRKIVHRDLGKLVLNFQTKVLLLMM